MRKTFRNASTALVVAGNLSWLWNPGPEWRSLAPLPESQQNAAAVEASDGNVYVYSGVTLLRYEPVGDRWTDRAPDCRGYGNSFTLSSFTDERRHKGLYLTESGAGKCTPGSGSPNAGRPSAVTDARGRPVWVSGTSGTAFEPLEDRWVQLPRARHHLKLSAYEGAVPWYRRKHAAFARDPDGRIYVIGGSVERVGPRRQRSLDYRVKSSKDSEGRRQPSPSVEIFDPATGSWSSVAPMRIPRQSAAAAFGADGKLYVFGGRYTRQSYNTASRDPLTPRLAEQHAYEGSIGYEDSPVLRSVEVYDPETAEWTLLGRMPRARENASAVLGSDGLIYVLGCPVAWGALYPQEACVFAYDPATDSWQEGPQLRKPRHSLAAAATKDGRIYAIGGSTLRHRVTLRALIRLSSEKRGGPELDVEVLELAPRPPTARLARSPGAVEEHARAVERLTRGGAALDRNALYQLELAVSPRDTEALGPLRRALSSPDWIARRSALRALGRMKATALPAAAEIEALLEDELEWVRREALDTLLAVGADPSGATPMLLAALRSEDFDSRIRASVAFAKVGPRAVPALEGALRDPTHPYPHECVEAMREIGPDAVPALVRAASSENRQVQVGAIFGLATIGAPSAEAAAAVEKVLARSSDWRVEYLSVYALSRLGPAGQEALLRALRDPRGHVELSAAWALADSDSGSTRVRAAIEAKLRSVPAKRGYRTDKQRTAYEVALRKMAGSRIEPPARVPAPSADPHPAQGTPSQTSY